MNWYLHFHDYQIWQAGIYKRIDSDETNQAGLISITTVPMVTKLGKMVTNLERILPKMLLQLVLEDHLAN